MSGRRRSPRAAVTPIADPHRVALRYLRVGRSLRVLAQVSLRPIRVPAARSHVMTVVNSDVGSTIDEIAAGVFRISIPMPP
ncbi:MAG: hypothetical protein WC383_03710, partial [Gammaproteobacteria bacterium]